MKKINKNLLIALLDIIIFTSCCSNVFAVEITTPETVSSVLLRDTINNINKTDHD